MNLGQSIATCYRKYADFSGRASRSEFWWYMLFYNVIVGIPIALVSEALDSIWSLANLVPALAVSARRLHDVDRSGWWQLLPLAALPVFLISFALRGFDVAVYSDDFLASPLIIAGILLFVALYVRLIVWFATKGNSGPNRFGEDPLGRLDADIFS